MTLFRNPRVAVNATALVVWPKIAEARTSVQSAAGNIVRNIVHPLLHNVQTATASTGLVIGNVPNIVVRSESEVLKIQTTSKVSYAAACRLHRQSATAVHPQTTFTHRSREFPPLPVVPKGSPIGYRPFPISKASTVHEQSGSLECVDFTTNFPFGNPLLFLAFLAQVVTETISGKDRIQPVDVFKIITDAAGERVVCQWMPNSLKHWPHGGSSYPPVELQIYL